jgi:hypothetical protein
MLGPDVLVIPPLRFFPRPYQGTTYPAGEVVTAHSPLLVEDLRFFGRAAIARSLLDASFLEVCSTTLADREVYDAARAEAKEHTVHRQLHPIYQLAAAIDHVVNGNGVDVLARSDPEISVGVRARRPRLKCRLVVR